MIKPKVAIVGAGIAGLTAARALQGHAHITLFDKSRGVGGRMSTRYAGDWEFDHGAQYFTVQTGAVADLIRPFLDSGIVECWQPARVRGSGASKTPLKDWTHPRYVAHGRMNALPKAMAEGLDIRLGKTVVEIKGAPGNWTIMTAEEAENYGHFDWVIVSAPAPQTSQLMPDLFVHRGRVEQSILRPCHALMLGFNKLPDTPWQAMEVKDSPLAWIARNDSKPGRRRAPAILCHTHADWSEAHLEEEPASLVPDLVAAFAAATGIDTKPYHAGIHLWRYALASKSAGSPSLCDADNRIIACGDWCVGGKVEAAFESGFSAAKSLLGCL